MVPGLAGAQSLSEAGVDRVAELQDAAINYEDAARTQESVAQSLLDNANPALPEEERDARNRRLRLNAALHVQACDQLMGAASNWDHAVRVWQAAVGSVREEASKDYFSQSARKASLRATTLVRRAAELAEQAALLYAEAGDMHGQVQASHKAGKVRENLAGRR